MSLICGFSGLSGLDGSSVNCSRGCWRDGFNLNAPRGPSGLVREDGVDANTSSTPDPPSPAHPENPQIKLIDPYSATDRYSATKGLRSTGLSSFQRQKLQPCSRTISPTNYLSRDAEPPRARRDGVPLLRKRGARIGGLPVRRVRRVHLPHVRH